MGSTADSLIPPAYIELAQVWGLGTYWGPIAAFIVAILFLFGLFYLGSVIALGRLVERNDNAKKALILISAMMGIIGAWYASGIMLLILSNLIFGIGIIMGGILLVAIIRALWGGWYAAGATLEEARAEYFESLQESEKARLEYIKTKQQIMNQLYTIIQQLYRQYGNRLDEKIVIAYLKSTGLYKDYIETFGSERKLRNQIKRIIEKVGKELANKVRGAYNFLAEHIRGLGKSESYKYLERKGFSSEDIDKIFAYLYDLLYRLVTQAKVDKKLINGKFIADLIATDAAHNYQLAKMLLKKFKGRELERFIDVFIREYGRFIFGNDQGKKDKNTN